MGRRSNDSPGTFNATWKGGRMKLRQALRDRARSIRDEIEAIAKGEDPRSVIPTGLREFDKRGGHKRKQVTVYGACSGEGKSLWALALSRAAAIAGYRVAVFSMEDPQERSADRALSTETDINSARLLAGEVNESEVVRIELAADDAEWADSIEWYDGLRTPDEILEVLDEDGPFDLAVVDYLSAFPHGKHGRERSISDFMWAFTKWCQENNVAGVAMAQLGNRPVEEGLDIFRRALFKDPEAVPKPEWFRGFNESDLMWCTDIGRNAKEVGFMQRPARIMKRLGFPAEDNVMEFNFPKRNWGAEGVLRVGVDPKTARFFDLETREKKEKKR